MWGLYFGSKYANRLSFKNMFLIEMELHRHPFLLVPLSNPFSNPFHIPPHSQVDSFFFLDYYYFTHIYVCVYTDR